MKHRVGMFAVVMGLLVAGSVSAAEQYKIDPEHSAVEFSAPHLVISKVKGHFGKVAGTITYDESDVTKSSVEATIQTDSIDTGVEGRDKHLRSPDFLDAAQFPTITFKSASVEKRGDGYVAKGPLTIRGVTKDVEMPFQVTGKAQDPWGNTHLGAEGAFAINRQDYGVSWNKQLDNGGVLVGDEVKITLNIEGLKQ